MWKSFLLAGTLGLGEAHATSQLLDLSLEELANMPVTSVFRRAEPLSEAPTSIYVISSEDLRRCACSTLAEALRLAPNLQVARGDARSYAISARGFNNAIGNKLLVLVDGRTVYSPLFSGVFWDQQDVVLEDVERIEVISGPGATQWGANAVNGVINVITREASATQGLLASVAAGETADSAVLRFGGRIGQGAFRAWAKGLDVDATRLADGSDVGDAWRRWQAGFRADWAARDGRFTVQGDTYEGKGAANALGTPTFSGSSLLARWDGKLADGSNLHVQAYADHAERDDTIAFRDRMRIYDVEAHHSTRWGARHEVVWGGGYRWARDVTERGFLIAFIPERKDLRWGNLFAQDTISLTDQVKVTAGVKLEHNVYTGWEVLPSLRLAWKPDDRRLVWGALSRAVRAPARLDREFFFPGNPPHLINGGPDFESEIADVAEIGYRAILSRDASISVSVFHNEYDKLRSGQPPPAVVQNMIDGHATGLEAWGRYHLGSDWRLSAGLMLLDKHLRLDPASTDPQGPKELGNDPRHQWMLRASYNPTRTVELDVGVRRVGKLPDPAVPAYTALDARVAWRVSPALEVSLAIRNALDARHVEFGATPGASEVERSAFVKVTWTP